jgi:polyisoprenyl-teichoic acid--peptidoglycan teichoic acid transferase
VDGPDHITIAIQDSTNQAEAVEKLINSLGSVGYSDIFIDQPWEEPLAVTRIIAQAGDADEARAIQKSLGFGEVLVESTGSLDSDITIQLGEDALAATTPTPVSSSSKPIAPPVEPDAPEASEVPVDSSSEVPVEAPIEAIQPSPQPEILSNPAASPPLPDPEQQIPTSTVDQSETPVAPASPTNSPADTEIPALQ